ncbi:T9SS C-terminal target domain-containing protein [Dysgonomonas sp. 216]|uniref:T9SS type A sorting domain-containing protein n=1 Tax=Dysgonomonas sp. 216 TaxID=2302934 RepID=UPI0013D02C83|nr:T9SS type A sorting domain-containing protein [Dysgonomonas sp. 216]NDW18436.1 T9SS C-terminal target domain-containing protein [Dysgonomonas sp. 216]
MKKFTLILSFLCLASMSSAQKPSFFLPKSKKKSQTTEVRSSDEQTFRYPQKRSSSKSVYRPTKVTSWTYWDDEILESQNDQITYKYDDYGHIISEEHCNYVVNLDMCASNIVITNKYEQLPNGLFVVSEFHYNAENGHNQERKKCNYDDKGMLLSSREEYYNSDEADQGWQLRDASETVVNAQGIRTGIKYYNSDTKEMELAAHLTFDNKGRLIKDTGDVNDKDYDENEWTEYKWNDQNMLSEISMYTKFEEADETESNLRNSTEDEYMLVTFTNITPIYGQEYFDIYSLQPADQDMDDDKYAQGYSISKQFLYNADILIDGKKAGTVISTVNASKTEMSTATKLNDNFISKYTTKFTDNYGSYTKIEEYYDEDTGELKETWERTVQYNEYYDEIRSFEEGKTLKTDKYYHLQEEEYDREYDTQKRPVKTTFYNRWQYAKDETSTLTKRSVETYSAWQTINLGNSINNVKVGSFLVYPNPTAGKIIIDGTEQPNVKIFDLSGKCLLQTKNNEINLSGFGNGAYLLQINDNEAVRIIKQ